MKVRLEAVAGIFMLLGGLKPSPVRITRKPWRLPTRFVHAAEGFKSWTLCGYSSVMDRTGTRA